MADPRGTHRRPESPECLLRHWRFPHWTQTAAWSTFQRPSCRAPMFYRAMILTLFVALAAQAWPMGARALEQEEPEVESVERGPAIGEAKLAPYFMTSDLRSALSELQAGRPANALRYLPRRPREAPVKWLKALALRGAGQPGPARALFEQLAIAGGPLTDRALHQAAMCAIDQGKGPAALRLLAQVSFTYVDADQVVLERARQTVKMRVAGAATADRVEEILEPIFSGQIRADLAAAHLTAGDAQLAAGQKEKARAHYRAAWVDRPLSAAAESARGRERQRGPCGAGAAAAAGQEGGDPARRAPQPRGARPARARLVAVALSGRVSRRSHAGRHPQGGHLRAGARCAAGGAPAHSGGRRQEPGATRRPSRLPRQARP